MSRDVLTWARACEVCQRAKIGRHIKPPIKPIPVPATRFKHIHIDLVGPLPPSQENVYILTMMDRTTRWVEAIPLPDSRAKTVAVAFVIQWVSRFGVPGVVTTNWGVIFDRSGTSWRKWG